MEYFAAALLFLWSLAALAVFWNLGVKMLKSQNIRQSSHTKKQLKLKEALESDKRYGRVIALKSRKVLHQGYVIKDAGADKA